MTTSVQNSSQTIVGNYNVQAEIALFESMTGYQGQDWIPFLKEVREMERVTTHSKGRLSRLPADDLDGLSQVFEDLSLFGRRKAEVILNPNLQIGSNAEFKETVVVEDGEVVPLVTLDDIKGSKVIIPFPSHDSVDSYLSSMEFGSLSQSVGVNDDLVHTTFAIPLEENEGKTDFDLEDRKVLSQLIRSSHSATNAFPLDEHVIPPDSTVPLRTIFERGVPTLHLALEGINYNASLHLHTDTRDEQIIAPRGTANPLVSQELLDYWNESLSRSSARYPLEQTPALANLPFPLESPVHSSQSINQSSQDLEPSIRQPNRNFPTIKPPTDLGSQSYDGPSSSDWSTCPNLSPSYTDSSSHDSILCTPTSSQSLTFPSPQSILATKSFSQSLPEQDVLAKNSSVNPALLSLNTLHFEKPFSAFVAVGDSHPPVQKRHTPRASRIHDLIQAQVPPGPLTMKPKIAPSNNGKGKLTVGDDSDELHRKECKKKKKRNEADKVRCEIEGCRGTFFSNWELKRHQENLHGIEKKVQYAAICPKCGRHFASGRKDSVDRHIELNACGKRNPRKSPKRSTAAQTS